MCNDVLPIYNKVLEKLDYKIYNTCIYRFISELNVKMLF